MAVLGLGGMGYASAKLYARHPAVEFTAFCDSAEGRAAALAASFQKETGYTVTGYPSYEEMRSGACYDAILLCCPPDIQVAYACAEMRRGIHVLSQVPAAFTIEECRELVRTVRQTGAIYQLAEQTRHWQFIRHWRELARTGAFGQILFAAGSYLHNEPAWDFFRDTRSGASVVTADPRDHRNPHYQKNWRYRVFTHPILYLPHTLSPLLSITGGRVTQVACMATRKGGYSLEGFAVRDIETALMQLSNDTLLQVQAGFTTPHGPIKDTGAHWYRVNGTKRAVEWARSTIDTPKSWTPEAGWRTEEWTTADEGETTPHGGVDGWPIATFIDAILRDAEPPVDVYTAVETAAPAILAAQSAEQGGTTLLVPDFRAETV